MNTDKYMIIVKGEIRTKSIRDCKYNNQTHKYDIQFNNGRIYSYSSDNVDYLKNPEVLNPNFYHISYGSQELFNISAIFVFENGDKKYWHICFEDGSERDYTDHKLQVSKSCLTDSISVNVYEYLSQIASLSKLKNDAEEKLLEKQYSKMGFIRDDTALSIYLNPNAASSGRREIKESTPIFPFGCNQSQYEAVKNALENPISVIQGPPGTGKTQTILNIIANILVEGKTVQVVSNNNSATENVLEKLSSPKYNMGFLVASLGKAENKRAFVTSQSGQLPNL